MFSNIKSACSCYGAREEVHPTSEGWRDGGRRREGFEKPLWGRKNCLACVHCTLCKRAFGIYESCCDSMCAARDKGAMCMAKRGREHCTVQVWTIAYRCVMTWPRTGMQGASPPPSPTPPLARENNTGPTAHAQYEEEIPPHPATLTPATSHTKAYPSADKHPPSPSPKRTTA